MPDSLMAFTLITAASSARDASVHCFLKASQCATNLVWGHYKQWTRGPEDPGTRGPGTRGPGDPGTRGPKDLQLLRETEMQLQAICANVKA